MDNSKAFSILWEVFSITFKTDEKLKERSAIDVVFKLIHKIWKKLGKKELAFAFFSNIKRDMIQYFQKATFYTNDAA